MVNQERIVQEFMHLVQISSPSKHERKVADYLIQRLENLGLSIQEDNAGEVIGGDSGNLIAHLPGSGPTLMFSAHMDTVQPGEGIVPVLEQGIISSAAETVLGGDDKAGICAILETLEIIKEHKLPHPNLEIVFTVAEEGGLKGAQALDASALHSSFGYCLDAGGPVGTIIARGPAQDRIKAIVHGKAAHAGICPEQGISAIQVAAEGIMRTRLGRIDADTTANIGVINGGTATNIVPDRVELEGEARSVVESKLDRQTQHMVETLRGVCRDKGAEAEIEYSRVYAAINLAEDSPVIDLAIKAATEAGFTPQVQTTGGGSDANVFNGKGLPTANLGIGMEKVHTTSEFIRVQDLLNSTNLLLAIVKLA
jgi:tripeptide aminopeptidase